MKKVSIVLPTYNGERYLRESIRSCLEQSYPEIELIVIDDGSTDGTPAILKDYAGDSRVTVVRNKRNLGLPAALNMGFARASGAYLTWTSDDNRYSPDALGRLVCFLDSNSDTGMVYADYWLMDADGLTIRRVSAGPPEHLNETCSIACFLYRREVYEAIGDYDVALFRIEDYDYWLRVARRFRLAWLAEPLYYYRRHCSSLTRTDRLENRARMFDEVQTKYFGPDSHRRKRWLSRYLIAEAFECHLSGDRSGVLRYCASAVRRDPGLLGNRGVVSILLQAVTGKSIAAVLRKAVRPGA